MSAEVVLSETAASLLVQSKIPPLNPGDYRSHDEPADSGQGGYLSEAKVVPIETQRDETDQLLVDFDGPEDRSNPVNWSTGRKWAIVILLSAVNVIANLATVMCIPAVPQILKEFGSTNTLYKVILVSVWELGEAVGPLFTAPLSEIFGRAPCYNAANFVFIIFSIACAVSSNLPMLVAFRLINGIGDASIALNPSIVSDMFIQEERGFPLAMVGFPPLIGPVAGPVIGGYLTEREGWRWAFWLSAIAGGICELGFLAFFRETYKPTILRKKAHALRERTGVQGLHSKYDHDRSETGCYTLRRAIFRPAQMLAKSSIVALLAIYVSIIYGFLYILLTTITEVFESTYAFTQGEAGLAYLGLSLGMVTGVLLCALTSDWWLKRQAAVHDGELKPEYRLPPMVLGGVLIPIGLFVYGWTARSHIFFIIPMLGTATLGFGFFVTTIPLNAYLVDAYKVHAASAIAATIVMRCIVAAVVPLAGPPIYNNLGYGWGNSLLGFIALALVPLPILFMLFGERIRKRSSVEIIT
ncbi:MAG: hypothetical protein LQ338_003995 [Usnochroma carphineum]|nr:MAG: hypothetical protein LQ338_003995 [Usnochroma carphineum]